MTWLVGNWSDPVRISEAIETEYWKKLPEGKQGVYRLFALAREGTFEPAPLERVCGTDPTGTLTIGGTAKPLLRRLSALVKTHRIDYHSAPHRRLPARLAERFPHNRLAFAWWVTDSPWLVEADLHKRYEADFGELPPMDRSG